MNPISIWDAPIPNSDVFRFRTRHDCTKT